MNNESTLGVSRQDNLGGWALLESLLSKGNHGWASHGTKGGDGLDELVRNNQKPGPEWTDLDGGWIGDTLDGDLGSTKVLDEIICETWADDRSHVPCFGGAAGTDEGQGSADAVGDIIGSGATAVRGAGSLEEVERRGRCHAGSHDNCGEAGGLHGE